MATENGHLRSLLLLRGVTAIEIDDYLRDKHESSQLSATLTLNALLTSPGAMTFPIRHNEHGLPKTAATRQSSEALLKIATSQSRREFTQSKSSSHPPDVSTEQTDAFHPA